MNKIEEFTQSERQKYSHLYLDLVTGADEIAPFLSKSENEQRYFNRRMHVIKDYLDALDIADQKASGEGFFERFKSDEQYKEEALKVKSLIATELEKLTYCGKCNCLHCTSECPFKSCRNCRHSYFVSACDKERYCIVSNLPHLSLYSNDEERDVLFKVLGLLRDHYSNKNYIYLVESSNPNNQHILEQVEYVNGQCDYNPLDSDILDKVYDTFVRFNCYE